MIKVKKTNYIYNKHSWENKEGLTVALTPNSEMLISKSCDVFGWLVNRC